MDGYVRGNSHDPKNVFGRFLTARRAWLQAIMAAYALALVGGCASMGPKSDGGAVGQVIRDAANNNGAPSNQSSAPSVASSGAAAPTGTEPTSVALEVRGQKLKSNKFDLPVIVNPSVEHWIAYFTGKGRKYFDKYLERSRYFIPTISKVLKAHGAPQDLVYLAMIESGFNNSARSRAKAVGPWQFIKQTGQRYGLVVDYWLDERRDTRKSTLASIQYLKELYQEFGSWELAAAGYNAGENKVRRAIAKYRTNNFWEIARHRFFKRETRDYVPKMFAAAILTKNAEQFGFNDPFKGRNKGSTVMVANASPENATGKGAAVEAAVVEDEPTPKELGEPVAKKDETPDDPADKNKQASNAVDNKNGEDESEDEDMAATVSNDLNSTITPSVYMVANPTEQIIEFEIKAPADLFAISKASGLPFSTVKLLNPELLRWCTPPSMKTYRVKLPKSVKDRFLATYNDESFDRRVVFMRYTVRRGDTVQKVARRFGIEPNSIRELNQTDLRSLALHAGSSINLPIPTGYKRVIASMYDEKPVYSRRRRVRRIHRHRRSMESASNHYRLRPSLTAKQ